MKRLITILLLTIILFICGKLIYFTYFHFTVLPSDEAIVTRGGKVIGEPKKPGRYQINPITNNVHFFDVEMLREWNGEINKGKNYKLRFWWQIKDPIKYFEESKIVKIEDEVNNIFSEVKYLIENKVELKNLNTISAMKKDNWDYTDSVLEKIKNLTDSKLSKYGVKVYRIDITN